MRSDEYLFLRSPITFGPSKIKLFNIVTIPFGVGIAVFFQTLCQCFLDNNATFIPFLFIGIIIYCKTSVPRNLHSSFHWFAGIVLVSFGCVYIAPTLR